jgi:hypothetical protein
MDSGQVKDSKQFLNRNDLSVSNANLFISNNANPFLISPYSPPANLVKSQQLGPINLAISTAVGNLSSVINLNTWTLRICTITSSPYYPDVTISTNNIFLNGSNEVIIDAPDITLDGSVYFPNNTYFNNISSGFIFASLADISSLNVSSINITDESVDFLTVNSTLNVSTILGQNININTLSTGNIFGSIGFFSTLSVSSIAVSNEIILNSVTVNSTLSVSTLLSNNVSTGNIFGYIGNFSTLNVLTLTSINQSTNYLSTGNLFAHNLQSFNQSTHYLSTGNLFAHNLQSFNQSTNYLSTGNLYSANITFETLSGNIVTVSSLTVSSLLNVSSISTSHILFETLGGSSITTNSLVVHSTLVVSSIHAASSITTKEFIFSSICMSPSNISSFVPAFSTFNSSILICLNGSYWKIPIHKA